MKFIGYILFVTLIVSCSPRHLAVVKINGKYGCINKKGDIVIQPQWDYILQGFKKNQILVSRDSVYGYIDNRGRVLIQPQYQDGNFFSNGLAAVSNKGKYGFINIKGDTIIPFIYDDVDGMFSRGLCDVTVNDSCGYINKKGDVVIPFLYTTCYPFKNKYATVMTCNYELMLIDKRGNSYKYDDINDNKIIYPPRHRYPGSFKAKTGQGRVRQNGDTIVPPVYKVTGNLSNGMYIVQDKHGKWGAYNKKGEIKVPVHFDGLSHFSKGLSIFKQGDKYGFINKKGEVVIKPVFDDLRGFSKGLAYAVVDNKVGYINKKGQFVIEPIFEPNNLCNSFE